MTTLPENSSRYVHLENGFQPNSYTVPLQINRLVFVLFRRTNDFGVRFYHIHPLPLSTNSSGEAVGCSVCLSGLIRLQIY